MAGEFTFKARVKTAVWRHVRLFLVAGVLGLVGLVYLILKGSVTM